MLTALGAGQVESRDPPIMWYLAENCQNHLHRDNDYGSQLIVNLNKARKMGVFCDVTIVLDNEEELRAHRVVLSAASKKFLKYFKVDGADGDDEEVAGATSYSLYSKDPAIINDIPAHITRTIIEYAYTGEAEITSRNVKELMEAASHFKFPALKHSCFQYVVNNMDPQNAFYILEYADVLGERTRLLVQPTQQYCVRHFGEAIINGSYLSLSPNVFLELIKSDDVVVAVDGLIPTAAELERIICQAVLRYVEHSEERKTLLPIFLPQVRLPLMTYDALDLVAGRVRRLDHGVNGGPNGRIIKQAKDMHFKLKKEAEANGNDTFFCSSDEEDDEEYKSSWRLRRKITCR